ncbi:MAG: 16S rRNA (cytidine(1402)-2'-O)-methyltransferase [Gammaproteobacteria bacterium]|nr:16S rRNA (cytidine(1402)-2'-O)-methyltransferase [Gammaproteobacteria bacterium]
MTQSSATTPGTLYLVATPIGNLQDMTFRAVDLLKKVSLILAEDTRHAKTLLAFYGIEQPVLSFHAHNEHTISQRYIQRLQQGETIALISDAGTPLIQDPGFPLVQLAIQHQLPVVPLPGPCALITALSGAGVACDSFLFAGFLPAKTQAKISTLQALMPTEQTLVFYESTHRILATIDTIRTLFGEDYFFVIAKELTKTFERFIRGTAAELLSFFHADAAHIKGEFVLILPPIPRAPSTGEDEKLLTTLLETLSLKQAITIAEKLSTTPKNTLYKQALRIQHTLKTED